MRIIYYRLSFNGALKMNISNNTGSRRSSS